MAQKIKQANIWGRVGSGLAEGMGLQLPKEMEHYRMSKGLKELEGQNLNPQQYFTRALSVSPGMAERPQVVQTLGELARQQMRGDALIQQQNQEKQAPENPFPPSPEGSPPNASPSITKGDTLEEIQKGFIPLNYDQLLQDAGRRYGANPRLYGNDPNNAFKAAEEAEMRRKSIYDAQKQKHADLQTLQDNVVSRLQDFSSRLKAQIPANVYSKIEDKAINAVKPKSEGGEGLTEQQAMKKYGDEMDLVSREYSKIKEMGGWSVTGRKAKDTQNALKSLQQDFEKRGDTENLADALIAEGNVSPKKAFSFAQPVYRVPMANKYIKNLPTLRPKNDLFQTVPDPRSYELTMDAAPGLAAIMKKEEKLSPLAVAHELEKKGYDPSAWMEYLSEHKKDLDLRDSQNRQLTRPLNAVDPLNDWWLESWSGIQ